MNRLRDWLDSQDGFVAFVVLSLILFALVVAVVVVLTPIANAAPRYPLLSTTDPAPRLLTATAPLYLGRPSCCADTARARSWMRLQIGVQRRAVDWAHPVFAPVVVAEGPETRPGAACTLSVARQQPGDVFVARWVNAAGPSKCWGGAKDSTSWKPIEAD